MTATRHERLAATSLYLVATHKGRGPPGPAWFERLAAAVAAGAGAVQLRLERAGTKTVVEAALTARRALGPEPLLLVNDDLEAVLRLREAGVDGLHLGRTDAAALGGDRGTSPGAGRGPVTGSSDAGPGPGLDAVAAGLRRARDRLGPSALLGTSTRDRAEVARALASGADHVGFGAMLPSRTKADTLPADPAELAAVTRRWPDLPVFPIGGLGPGRLAPLVAAGCARAAVGSAIMAAADPRATVARCLEELRAGG